MKVIGKVSLVHVADVVNGKVGARFRLEKVSSAVACALSARGGVVKES
jgi:hypothetical protein